MENFTSHPGTSGKRSDWHGLCLRRLFLGEELGNINIPIVDQDHNNQSNQQPQDKHCNQ
jgi:hypothetical protein